MDEKTPAAAPAISCEGSWYALFQGDKDALFLIPLIGWERSGPGQTWVGLMTPMAAAPPSFRLTGYVRGIDVANMRPTEDGHETVTWDELFDELMASILRHNLEQAEA